MNIDSNTILLIVILCFFIVLLTIIFLFSLISIKYVKKNNKNFFKRKKNDNQEFINLKVKNKFANELISTLEYLQNEKIGALIVLSNKDDLDFFIKNGFQINCKFSPELLICIFNNKRSALHDGAIIIKDMNILSVSSYLPMTKSLVDVKYGARHRAAIGMTERNDSLVFVVSETTGMISYAIDGKLYNFSKNNFDNINMILKYI